MPSLSFTWYTQRKSTLDLKHMDHTANGFHTSLQQSRARHHSCSPGFQGRTPRFCQYRRILFDSCGCNVQSSGTHDTPGSIRMDNHSVRASLALSHVTRHSRRHKLRCGLGGFCQKGWTTVGTQCHTSILRAERHLCTDRTLEPLEGKDNSLRLQSECNALHPWFLIRSKK